MSARPDGYEKVISSVKEGNIIKVYYRDTLIGSHLEGDTETMNQVVEAAVDTLVERRRAAIEPIIEKLMKMQSALELREALRTITSSTGKGIFG